MILYIKYFEQKLLAIFQTIRCGKSYITRNIPGEAIWMATTITIIFVTKQGLVVSGNFKQPVPKQNKTNKKQEK